MGKAPRPEQLAGRTLRMLRETHQVSLRRMAKIVGISATHLSRVERGELTCTRDVAMRLCQAIAVLPVPASLTIETVEAVAAAEAVA